MRGREDATSESTRVGLNCWEREACDGIVLLLPCPVVGIVLTAQSLLISCTTTMIEPTVYYY